MDTTKLERKMVALEEEFLRKITGRRVLNTDGGNSSRRQSQLKTIGL